MLSIKEETGVDDILLFTQAEMDAVTGNNPNFEIENIVDTVNISESSSFPLQSLQFADEHVNQILSNDSFSKVPVPADMYKTEASVKSERPLSHVVKYKVQDGKHTKVWQCGICNKEFGHQYILMRHLPTHTDERKFQCNTCGKGLFLSFAVIHFFFFLL